MSHIRTHTHTHTTQVYKSEYFNQKSNQFMMISIVNTIHIEQQKQVEIPSDIPQNLHTFILSDIHSTDIPLEGFNLNMLGYRENSTSHLWAISEIPRHYGEGKGYTWDTEKRITLGTLQVLWIKQATIGDKKYDAHIYDTIHSYAYQGYFKPTIYEALLPIPKILFDFHPNEPIYITSVYAGMSRSQKNHYGITILLTPAATSEVDQKTNE